MSIVVEEGRPSPSGEASVVGEPKVESKQHDRALVVEGRDRQQVGPLSFRSVAALVAPWLMAAIALAAGFLAVQRASALIGWEGTFTGSGRLVVTSCEPFDQWGPDQWHCQGRFSSEEASTARSSTMVVSRGAMPSFQPYVGQQWDVFFAPSDGTSGSSADDPEFVYADQLQLSEIARLYLSIFPRVLLALGCAGWVVGWWFKRRSGAKPGDWWVRRLPGMQLLQRRSAGWILVAVTTYVIYRLIAYYLLGSVGVA